MASVFATLVVLVMVVVAVVTTLHFLGMLVVPWEEVQSADGEREAGVGTPLLDADSSMQYPGLVPVAQQKDGWPFDAEDAESCARQCGPGKTAVHFPVEHAFTGSAEWKCQCYETADECLALVAGTEVAGLRPVTTADRSVPLCPSGADQGGGGADDPPPPTQSEGCTRCSEPGYFCRQTFSDVPDEWDEYELLSETCHVCGAGDQPDTYRKGCGGNSPGVLTFCRHAECAGHGYLSGCGGASEGTCLGLTQCAEGLQCIRTSQRDDCTCISPASYTCAPGQGKAGVGMPCETCEAATRSTNYHFYSAMAPLLRQSVHLYYDTVDFLPKYRAHSYSSPNYKDAGTLTTVPHGAVLSQPGVFQPGDVVTIDTLRGIVHLRESAPDAALRDPDRGTVVNAFVYDAAFTKSFALLPADQLSSLPPDASWDAIVPEGHWPAGTAITVAGGGGDDRPAVTFVQPGGPPLPIGAGAATWVRSLRDMGVDSAAGDPSLFDYTEFDWATGVCRNPAEASEYLGGGGQPPPAATMQRVLVVDLPRGTMDEATGAFDWDGTFARVSCYNRAQPSACLSCKAREARECPDGTLLVGCGFQWAGVCATCFQDEQNPCGNCQSSRLRAMLPDGRMWTDAELAAAGQDEMETGPNIEGTADNLALARGTGDHAVGDGSVDRVAQACQAMPPHACAWDGSLMRHTRYTNGDHFDESTPNAPTLQSTYHGGDYASYCCAPGDVRLDGPAGAHCVRATGVPFVRNNSTLNPGGVAWTPVPRVAGLPPQQVVLAQGDPLNWPELVTALEFYGTADGTGEAMSASTTNPDADAWGTVEGARSCRLGPLSTLTLRDPQGRTRIFENSSVTVTLLVFSESGWDARADSFRLRSVIGHPREIAPVPEPQSVSIPSARLTGVPADSYFRQKNPETGRCYNYQKCSPGAGGRTACEKAECDIRGMRAKAKDFPQQCPSGHYRTECEYASGLEDKRTWRPSS